MFDREQAKERSRRMVKRHYVLFLITLLFASFIGSGYKSSFSAFYSYEQDTVDSSSVLYEALFNDIDYAKLMSEELQKSHESKDKILGVQLGRSEGTFAFVSNEVGTGSYAIQIYMVIKKVMGNSDMAGKVGLALTGLFIYLLVSFFRCVYKIAYKRIFLESYYYKKVKSSRFSYLIKCRKVINSALSAFVKDCFLNLWWLTIVGGIIKSYSYSQAEFITAENPTIKPFEAIKLSRRMMTGHKWELFKNEASFMGWFILDFCTFGISALLFSNAYLEAFRTQYYAYVRKLAIENKVEGYELLNDTYLFEYAPMQELKEAYSDIIDKKDLVVTYPVMKGIKGFFARNFGIVLRYDDTYVQYQKAIRDEDDLNSYKEIFGYKTYPSRLSPIKWKGRFKSDRILAARRQYSLVNLCIFFFIFCFVGWIWEVYLHFQIYGIFVNRGYLHGPSMPEYGIGILTILVLLYRFRDNVPLEFASGMLACGVVEYIVSYLTELFKGLRWWDYSNYFMNLNGRICAEGILLFGLGGLASVYVLIPLIDNLLKKVNPIIEKMALSILIAIFMVDNVICINNPNAGKYINDYDLSQYKELKY